MCLLVIAYAIDSEYPLIVAGNRDEFHARPSRPAGWWPEAPGVLGGRDLQSGGSWLALHRSGRFATVTNFRDAVPVDASLRSRGHLVTDYLESDLSPMEYLRTIDPAAYAGFNLLVSDGSTLAYSSNRGGRPLELEPGIYGLSNATLDAPWTKVERSKRRLEALLAAGTTANEPLLDLLGNRDRGPVEEAAGDVLPPETAHAITAPFIVLPDYGTRCSTVVHASANGQWQLTERRFDARGQVAGESAYAFERA